MNKPFPFPPQRRARGYSAVAIALHWLTAGLILLMLPMGWWMARAIADPGSQQAAYQAFQLHKAMGFTILALTLIRLAWRVMNPPPPMPPGMTAWERFMAFAAQGAFYGLLVALPLSGWAYVSTGWSAGLDRPLAVATSWFGLFPIPNLPGLDGARQAAFGAMGAHGLMAWGAVILIGLHAGAALKHHFINRDAVLSHMLPVVGRGNTAEETHEAAHPTKPARGGLHAMAVGVLAVALLAGGGWTLSQPEPLSDEGRASDPIVGQALQGDDAPGTAQAWSVDPAGSSIIFSGEHSGRAFEGRFDDWDARIWFDPIDLAGSKVVARIRTASARTGDGTQEGSLKGADWFNVARFTEARFESDVFRHLSADRYEAEGVLTVKDRAVPVILAFRLAQAGEEASIEGEVTLDRLALGLGAGSDPAAEWVSRAIAVRVTVRATAMR